MCDNKYCNQGSSLCHLRFWGFSNLCCLAKINFLFLTSIPVTVDDGPSFVLCTNRWADVYFQPKTCARRQHQAAAIVQMDCQTYTSAAQCANNSHRFSFALSGLGFVTFAGQCRKKTQGVQTKFSKKKRAPFPLCHRQRCKGAFS